MPAAFGSGSKNLITDIAGMKVGHATDVNVRSGVTSVFTSGPWAAGVDVRGGGPGVRETEALAPENLVGRADAIVLAGGSVFGLAAADGVAAYLSANGIGIGLRPGAPPIPIVPAAVLHDLGNGGDKTWGMDPPYRRLGIESARTASECFDLGAVGAGRGAMAGLIAGGVGSASLDLGAGLIVGALVAVNCVGSVLMPDDRTFWAHPFEIAAEFGGGGPPVKRVSVSDPMPAESRLRELGRLQPGVNTIIGVVACNATLGTAECKRIAMMAHDGIARAVRPSHTHFDGDTIFALASGATTLPTDIRRAAQLARIGSAAADCVTRAIARGVYTTRQALAAG